MSTPMGAPVAGAPQGHKSLVKLLKGSWLVWELGWGFWNALCTLEANPSAHPGGLPKERRKDEEGQLCSAPRTPTFPLLFLTPQLSLFFSSLPCDVSWDNAGMTSQFHTWSRQGRQRKQDLPFSTQIIALQSPARFSLLCRVQSTSIPKVHTDLRLFQALAAASLYLLLFIYFYFFFILGLLKLMGG